MNRNAPRCSLLARVVAAVGSVALTALLFSAVISTSEPQRAQLAALSQPEPAAQPKQMLASAESAEAAR
jgi:hypothetical protein